jgi:hypothetical protein
MIRAADLSTATAWVRPLSTSTSRTDTRDSASWFDAAQSDAAIHADVSAAARGLSVEQHASRVLMHLFDDGERGA